MKNYYSILGLTIYATDADIKRAYRKLALQYHPDKNATVEAEEIFKEVNEAYEILGDRSKKISYDQILRGSTSVAETEAPAHRDPRYHPRPAGSFSKKSKRQEAIEVMAENMRYALLASRVALVFVIVLLLDFVLPQKKEEQMVMYTSYRKEMRGGRQLQLNLKDGETFTLEKKVAGEFKEGVKVFVFYTRLFSVPRTVENDQSHFIAKIPVSIYGNFIFGPLIMLITSLLGVFYNKGIEFRFNLGVVNALLILLCLIFLKIHIF